MDYTESVTQVLNDDVLLNIFKRLHLVDLLNAEQVCGRWENVVKRTLGTLKTFDMSSVPKTEALRLMHLCDPNLRRLVVSRNIEVGKDIDCIEEIAERFPNLEYLDLHYFDLDDDHLDVLSTKCKRLNSIKISSYNLKEKGLGLLLTNLPGLSSLTVRYAWGTFGNCFANLGPNLERIHIGCQVTKSGYAHILSKSRKLKKISLSRKFNCDGSVFYSFCQGNVTLRSLAIEYSDIKNETLVHISHCSMLEELRLYSVQNVDSNTLKRISEGCPNLKRLEMANLPLICDQGLKYFVSCKHLTTFAVYRSYQISDESLLKLAEVGILKKLVVANCNKFTDVGCSAVLARCPQLEELNASRNRRVGDATVDAAIEAVERRNNGLSLRLVVIGTRVDRSKGAIEHPLLKVVTEPELYLNNNKIDIDCDMVIDKVTS